MLTTQTQMMLVSTQTSYKNSLSLSTLEKLKKWNFYFSSRTTRFVFLFLFLLSKLEIFFIYFSFSSRNWRNDFKTFFLFSKLRKNEDFPQNFLTKFSFSSRNLKNYLEFLFLFLNQEKLISNFSFSSRFDILASRHRLTCTWWDRAECTVCLI